MVASSQVSNRSIGVVFVVLAALLYVLLRGEQSREIEGERRVTVKLEDVTGLPQGTPVYMAGLPIGFVERRELAGRYARLTLRVDDGIVLGTDARLVKRSPSLLSGPILELDPGDPATTGVLEGEITHVDEERTGETLRAIEETLPEIDQGAVDLRAYFDDLRVRTRNDVAPAAEELERDTEELATDVTDALRSTNDFLAGKDDISFDAEKEIGGRLDSAEEGTATLKTSMQDGTSEVRRVGAEARQRIDDFDIRDSEGAADFIDTTTEIDQGEGTLGELVNDPALANDIEDVVGGVKTFVDTITRWRMHFGLRNEYRVASGLPHYYVTLRARRRPGSFYYIEIEKGPRGGVPDTSLVYDHEQGLYRRRVRIEERLRFTLQWAKELGPLVLRAGIKESTPGAGADLLLGDRLELSADLYELNTLEHPRLKVGAAYRLFGSLYVLGGVDDALNEGRRLDIEPLAVDVPIQFEELYLGRDLFFGASLRFDDRDLAALLTVGGDALVGAAD